MTFTYDPLMRIKNIDLNTPTEEGDDFNFDYSVDISYYENGKVKRVDDYEFTYNEFGYEAINILDPERKYIYYNDGDSCSLKRYYFYSNPFNSGITSSKRLYEYDYNGNVTQYRDADQSSFIVLHYVLESLMYGKYEYDTRLNKFWNIPDEVCHILNLCPGENNPKRYDNILFYSGHKTILYDHIYNDNGLPAFTIAKNITITGTDTTYKELWRAEMEYFN